MRSSALPYQRRHDQGTSERIRHSLISLLKVKIVGDVNRLYNSMNYRADPASYYFSTCKWAGTVCFQLSLYGFSFITSRR